MNQKYVIVHPPAKKIIDTSPTLPKLDPAEVAKALGAKPGGAKIEGAPGPITLFAVRQELFRRLQSTGGRPGLPDADKVGKVPLSEKQWKRMEELAAAISEEGFAPSAGQVANVLLTWVLNQLGPDAIKKLAEDIKATIVQNTPLHTPTIAATDIDKPNVGVSTGENPHSSRLDWPMAANKRTKILIWGKTRPELSRTYLETVCTGGVLPDTKQLIRLYPIPLRFLNDEQVFAKYQWIEATIRKAKNDPRPESYNIDCDDIVALDKIDSEKGTWGSRAEWILQPQNTFRSVFALQEAQQALGTSLGLVKPTEILDFHAESFPKADKDDFWTKYKSMQAIQEIPFEPELDNPKKPLSPPDYRFKVRFRCEGEGLEVIHDFCILDWELDALYANLRKHGDAPTVAKGKVIDKLKAMLDLTKNDVYFYLGNTRAHPQSFSVVGLWYPKKAKQASLF